jgi:hypothetical protein
LRPQDSAFSGSCACFPQVQLKNPDGTGLHPGSACSKIFPFPAGSIFPRQVACWKGKSRLNAWKNQLVDQRTNSVQEGFRLEGIEGPPKSLEDRIHAVMDPSKAKGLAAAKYISPKAGMAASFDSVWIFSGCICATSFTMSHNHS